MNWVAYLIVGLISGFFIGLIGIGSGMIIVPGLTMAGMTVKQAVTSGLLLQAIPQTLPGFITYRKNGHFLFNETMLALLGSITGIMIGTYIQYQKLIAEVNAYRLLSLILVISGFHVYYFNVWNPPLEKEVKQKT